MNRKKLMAILAAGVFALTYVNTSYVMAEVTATEEGSTDDAGTAADADGVVISCRWRFRSNGICRRRNPS